MQSFDLTSWAHLSAIQSMKLISWKRSQLNLIERRPIEGPRCASMCSSSAHCFRPLNCKFLLRRPAAHHLADGGQFRFSVVNRQRPQIAGAQERCIINLHSVSNIIGSSESPTVRIVCQWAWVRPAPRFPKGRLLFKSLRAVFWTKGFD